MTWVINPAVGCHYFPPGLQLPSQPLRGMLPISLLGEQRHDGCEQFAWDSYPTASRLRFEPGPFCAWVHHVNHSATEPPCRVLPIRYCCYDVVRSFCENPVLIFRCVYSRGTFEPLSLSYAAKNLTIARLSAEHNFNQPTFFDCITSSQFSLLAALALHLWSHSLVHPHHLLYEQQIVPSSMLPLVSGIKSRLPPV